nr:MAG TPA: acetyltransferase [Caudoviricetes sp.]
MTRIAIFEPSPELYDEIERLGALHKDEVEAEVTALPVAINRNLYDALYAQGALVCVGAFDDDRLVGYAIALFAPNLHYQMLSAAHDVLFLHRDYRTPRMALRLIDAVEAECKARGAQLMVWHAPIGGAFERILKTRANPIYTQFFKEL